MAPFSRDAAGEQSTQVFVTPSSPPTLHSPVVPPPQLPTAEQNARWGIPPDFVPGDAGVGTAPPLPSRRRLSYGPRARAALAGIVLVVLSVLLLQLGLGLRIDAESLWSVIPLWSGFASLAAVLGLLAFVPDAPGRSRLRPRSGWQMPRGD